MHPYAPFLLSTLLLAAACEPAVSAPFHAERAKDDHGDQSVLVWAQTTLRTTAAVALPCLLRFPNDVDLPVDVGRLSRCGDESILDVRPAEDIRVRVTRVSTSPALVVGQAELDREGHTCRTELSIDETDVLRTGEVTCEPWPGTRGAEAFEAATRMVVTCHLGTGDGLPTRFEEGEGCAAGDPSESESHVVSMETAADGTVTTEGWGYGVGAETQCVYDLRVVSPTDGPFRAEVMDVDCQPQM